MKEFLRQQLEQKENALQKTNLIREYLQARILQVLQEQGVFMDWAFLGGTALRFLYGLPRYSEDLDFSLMDLSKPCEFEKILRKVKTVFENENYTVSVKISREKTVRSAFIKFPGLLFEMGASPHESEVLSVKFEVDTNPPRGAGTETTLCRRFVTVNVNHYDKASLLAGKLHAVLSRQYTKGRDLYDLVWYLADRTWPAPNLDFLNAALVQTGWGGVALSTETWCDVVAARIDELHWGRVRDDLMPFLERQEELALVTKENCIQLLEQRRHA